MRLCESKKTQTQAEPSRRIKGEKSHVAIIETAKLDGVGCKFMHRDQASHDRHVLESIKEMNAVAFRMCLQIREGESTRMHTGKTRLLRFACLCRSEMESSQNQSWKFAYIHFNIMNLI